MHARQHQRRSIRLPGYNYAQPGAYFITLCAQQRASLFGEIHHGTLHLNDAGHIVLQAWHQSAQLRPNFHFDRCVVMPNHTTDPKSRETATTKPGIARRRPRSLSSFIASFKATTTKRINDRWNTHGMKIWQRNFYEHIICDEIALDRIRTYINDNPRRWQDDKLHPNNPSPW